MTTCFAANTDNQVVKLYNTGLGSTIPGRGVHRQYTAITAHLDALTSVHNCDAGLQWQATPYTAAATVQTVLAQW